MGIKTEDEAGVETGAKEQRDEAAVDLGKESAAAGDTGSTEDTAAGEGPAVAGSTDEDERADGTVDGGSGVASGAAAIVSAGLGIVSLTGSWVGTVAQARESLFGQLETAQSSTVATQIKQVYADSWSANALVAGFFALAALIVGVAVLVRPAFGNPDRVQAPWVKSVAWAGVSIGFIGLLLAALKYSDVLLSMPSAS
ncbi:hypothetical protein [Streptomyces fructofermentans]|nr:hypothetical protein [Streptomyces fructofermentans]